MIHRLALILMTILAGALTSAPAETISFTNNATILIPDVGNTDGPANPYPSSISVSNVAGPVASITITLYDFSHGSPYDLDMLLEGPGEGRATVFFAGPGEDGVAVTNLTLTFDDAALNPLLEGVTFTSGTYKPSVYIEGFFFDLYPPAPSEPYGNTLSYVVPGDVNGQWNLYINDNVEANTGLVVNGWSLSFTLSESNIPPVFVATAPQIVTEGGTLAFSVTANDIADQHEVTLTATNLPGDAEFFSTNGTGTASGTLLWTNAGPVGVYTSYFFAADTDGVTTQAVQITVRPVITEYPVYEVKSITASGGNLVLHWESTNLFTYALSLSTNLLIEDGFVRIVTNIPGAYPESSVTTTPVNAGAAYRIEIEEP